MTLTFSIKQVDGIGLGVPAQSAWSLAKSGKGWWRLSKSIPIHHAMDNAWFEQQGLINLTKQGALLKDN